MRKLDAFRTFISQFGMATYLVVSHVIVFSIVLTVFGTLFYSRLQDDAYDSLDRILAAKRVHVEENLSRDLQSVSQRSDVRVWLGTWLETIRDEGSLVGTILMVRDSEGVIVMTDRPLPVRPRTPASGYASADVLFADGHLERCRLLVGSREYRLGGLEFRLILARPLEYTQLFVDSQMAYLVVFVAILLLVLVAAEIALVRVLMRPLEHMAHAMKELGPESWDGYQHVDALPKELRLVSRRFDELITRLRTSFDQRKRFTEDLAHQLRTPLTVLRMQIDGLSRRVTDIPDLSEALAEQKEEVGRLSAVIDSLLMISRYESMSHLKNPVLLSPHDILLDLVELYVPLAQESGTEIVSQLDKTVRILGEENLFRQAMINLIDNAVKYGKGCRKIDVSALPHDDQVLVCIRNYGPPIEPVDQERIFERFYRSSTNNANGYGLGLSVVRQVVNLHHGRIWVESSAERGTAFMVSFPLA